MTSPAADEASEPHAADGRSRSICPYLLSTDGTWRGATVVRSHRCAALDPPAPIASSKQRRFCLVADHVRCPTYVAAAEALTEIAPSRSAKRFPVPRTTPVVLERSRTTLTLAVLARQRGLAQWALLVLMGVALAAILVARVGNPTADPGAALGSPPLAGASSPSTTPPTSPPLSPSPFASPSLSPSPSPSPSPTRTPEASPTPQRTYVVQAGDNLSAIAARFGTTVKVLVELNDIANPSLIHVGQVLVLP
jgi:nucleoid-associated protein YgaU